MQDKDFDQLFKQRFEAYEVEPTASAWQKITKDLDRPGPKKKNFTSFWMAAASVLILISAGLWLYRPVKVIQLHGKPENQVAKVETKLENVNKNAEIVIASEPKPVEAIVSRPSKASFAVLEKRPVVNRAYTEKTTRTANISEKDEAVNTDYLANQPAINPLKNTKTALSQESKQVMVAQVDEMEIESNSVDVTTKPRIRSIGGLVNFVIAQVDKRDDKIIEFKDGEEGSAVSGINIGPLKFKSRNK